MVYCIENYKDKKGKTGKEVVDIFNQFSVFDFISSNYDALHTTGKDYITEDIDLFIQKKKSMQAPKKSH